MIAILIAAVLLFFDVQPSTLERAQQAYGAHEFASALALFEQASTEDGAPLGAVLFGMGNCAYRLGHPAEAVRQYLRALRHAPRNREVWANLRLAQKQLGLEAESRRSLATVVGSALVAWTPRERLWIAVLLQSAGLAGALLVRRRSVRRWLCVAVALLGLAIALTCASARLSPPRFDAVVLTKALAVRAEPHASLPPKFRLREGVVVNVAESSDRWARIDCAEGSGWLERTGIGLVD